jgi:hypothetical protein
MRLGMEIDERQEYLIRGWVAQAQEAQNPYFRFVSLWIAFNALCYALYHDSANRQRADLKTFRRGSPEDGYLEAKVHLEDDKVEIAEPALEMKLRISEKYTEDFIFAQFARETQERYTAELEADHEFSAAVDRLRDAMKKPNGFYVLNLSHKNCAEVATWTDQQVRQSNNLLRSFHDKRKLSLLKDALYQVRCNVFHGEKVPGYANDDQLVEAASPVLRKVVEFYLPCMTKGTVQTIRPGAEVSAPLH